jgi:diguanylate cyclase (GGDEF)-like protein
MGGESRRANPGRLKRDIYVAAGLTVAAFVFALFFIVDRASFVANGIALESDVRLISAELADQRYNAESYMNEGTTTLDGFMTLNRRQPDMDFMADELKGWMSNAYGLQQVVVVDADGSIRLGIKDGEELENPQSLAIAPLAPGLAERARAYFRKVEPTLPDHWEDGNAADNVRHLYVVSEPVALDGQFGFLMAQQILPWNYDGHFDLGDGHVHVAFRTLDRGDLAAAVERLNLDGFRVTTIADAPDQAARFDATKLDGSPAFALLWNQPDPRRIILFAVLPLGVALVSAITALLAIMLRRYRTALSELAASEERNRQMANHDSLTGLANRAQFDARLDEMIGERPQGGFAVMCIDLDKFKAVNDTYGHNAGDAVLVAAASRFAERVGSRGLVARVGGDEFVVLVTAGIKPSMLQTLGEELIADACEPVMFEGAELRIGASIGVSIWPTNGQTAKEIIHAADQVLYDSKRAGRGRCTLCDQPDGRGEVTEAA